MILVNDVQSMSSAGAMESTVSSRMMLIVWFGLPRPGPRFTETLPELGLLVVPGLGVGTVGTVGDAGALKTAGTFQLAGAIRLAGPLRTAARLGAASAEVAPATTDTPTRAGTASTTRTSALRPGRGDPGSAGAPHRLIRATPPRRTRQPRRTVRWRRVSTTDMAL